MDKNNCDKPQFVDLDGKHCKVPLEGDRWQRYFDSLDKLDRGNIFNAAPLRAKLINDLIHTTEKILHLDGIR